MIINVISEGEVLSMSAVDYRRALHRIPELDNQLPETVQLVQRILAPLPCRVFSPITGSVCAWFDAGKSDAVAFRAELDALPVTEATDLPYASVHPGRMHACGHDAHTAMVLTLAEYAAEHLAELPRNVLFLFQPSEETTGGAGKLCESGVLERYRVRRIFGLHLWPGLEAGTIASRPGPLMARSNEVTVTVEGRSVHMSRADEGLDALTAGISYLQRAYDMMEQLPPDQPRVLRFGKMVSGTVRNAISGRTVLEGSLRTYREDTFRFCRQQLKDIGRSVAAETVPRRLPLQAASSSTEQRYQYRRTNSTRFSWGRDSKKRFRLSARAAASTSCSTPPEAGRQSPSSVSASSACPCHRFWARRARQRSRDRFRVIFPRNVSSLPGRLGGMASQARSQVSPTHSSASSRRARMRKAIW